MYLMSQSSVTIFAPEFGVLATPVCCILFYYFNNLFERMLSWKKNKYVNMYPLKSK